MKLADEWVKIAKKYLPELNDEQEDLVRRLAKCKKYGSMKPHPYFGRITVDVAEKYSLDCNCSLCLQVAFHNLRREQVETVS